MSTTVTVDIAVDTWTVEGETFYGATIEDAETGRELLVLDGATSRDQALLVAIGTVNRRGWKLSARSRALFA